MRRYRLKRKLKGVVFAIIAEMRFLKHLHFHDRPAYHREMTKKLSSGITDPSDLTPRAHEAVQFFSAPSLPLEGLKSMSIDGVQNPLI